MKLILLGTSGYHPSDSRQTACLMLPELGVVLDAGTAMYRAAAHLVTDELDIFVTHAHLDHVIGLTYLWNVTQDHPLRQVRVHGAAEKLSVIEEHLFATALFPVKPPFEICPLDGEVALKEGGRLTHFPLKHPGGSLGFRLDWPDRSLAYVTDTTAALGADYVEKIRGVDLLVHECTMADDMPDQAKMTGHSCPVPVAEVAAAAGVDRLVLVHINPLANGEQPLDLDAAEAIFPKIVVGTDNLVLEF